MKVAILSKKHETLIELRDFLATEDGSIRAATFAGDVSMVPALMEQDHPDVLLLEGALTHLDLADLERTLVRFPGLTAILLCSSSGADFLLHAMRIGVREVLPAPASREALRQAFGRIRQRVAWASLPRSKGRILAFLPCKGGSGATFLAANLAYVLAASENKRVALIDLNLFFGDAALYVADAVPASTIADVARQIQRLDGAFLESSMMQVLPGFRVLAAPESPDKVGDVGVDEVERLLNVAVSHYDFVVLDVGRNLSGVSIKALDHAEMVFPVLQTTLPFIRDAKRVTAVFHSLGYPKGKIRLIVNRFAKGGEIGLDDVERTLGLSVYKTVPNSFAAVASSVNQGTPIVRLAPRDPVARSLQEIARDLARGTRQQGQWIKELLNLTH